MTEPTETAPAPAVVPVDDPTSSPPRDGRGLRAPQLAEGIELIGQFEDSGFKEAPYIARRPDGQVIQLAPLLYALAEQVDGARGNEEIARRLTERVGRGVSADNVHFLIEEKLRPLGVLAAADGSSPQRPKADPLLALKLRTAVIPDRVVRSITTVFRPLFLPPIVVAVVAGFLALDGWLFFVHGISQSLRGTLYQPALLLMMFGGLVLATAFHEIGHATACRYSGAKPGVMGVGIYIVWPAFYTDITDAYRLGKGGRLRTDLGGIYFNAIFALAVSATYFATGFEPLLLLVVIQTFAIIQQSLPLLRLDGYYIISDLTGVPDMLSRIRPTLASLIPGRRTDERVKELKPWVRGVVTSYVLTVVPILIFSLVMMLINAPRVFATAYDSVGVRYDATTHAFDHGQALSGLGGILQMGTLVLPLAGMVFTTGRIGKRAGAGAWRWTEGSPARRALMLVPTAALAAFSVFLWWPNGEYRPIQKGEVGTVFGGVKSLGHVASGRPALTRDRERQLHGAPNRRGHTATSTRSRRGGDATSPVRARSTSKRDVEGPVNGDTSTKPTEESPSAEQQGTTPSPTGTPDAPAGPSPADGATTPAPSPAPSPDPTTSAPAPTTSP